jgi:DNA repair protein RecO (recombination protein O)
VNPNRATAIICAVRNHGETGTIVRALTPQHGLIAGYVRGGRSRMMRPVLIPSNIVDATWKFRGGAQLASLSVELIQSRAPLMAEPLAAAALDWVTALAAATLPEGHPYPQLHMALDGVLSAIEAAPAARGWSAALARYEQLLLVTLGYAEGTIAAAMASGWDEVLPQLAANGSRIERHLLGQRRVDVMAARGRLIDRLKRAVA